MKINSAKTYLFFVLSFIFSAKVTVAQIVISLPDTSGLYNSNILIPVVLDNPNNKRISSYEFEVKFDNSILKPINVIATGTLTQSLGWTFNKDLNKDNIEVDARGFFPITKSGVLIYLEFKILSETGFSELKFRNFKLNSGSLSRTLTNGSIKAFAERSIFIDKIGNGNGKVFINDEEINLPYESKVIKGQNYSIRALPYEQSVFKEWSGSINSLENPIEFTVVDDISITAIFDLKKYVITAVVNPINYGTVMGTGTFNYNQEILLTAMPSEGKKFINWEFQNQVISNENTLSVQVTEDKEFTANFALISYNIQGTVEPFNSGNILGLGEYEYGEFANITAIPNTGWNFVEWELNSNFYSNNPSITLEVKNDINLTAKFSKNVYSLNVTIEPNEGGTVIGAGNYNYNQTVNLSAIPNDGWNFEEWRDSNGFISSELNITVEIKKNIELIAKFRKNIYSVNLLPEPVNGGVVSGGGLFYFHQVANITAQENYGWEFVNWTNSGVEVTKSRDLQYSVEGNVNLKANFKRQLFTINIYTISTEAGIVSGNGFYFYEQEAYLSAKAFNGWKFLNWTENDSIISYDSIFTFSVDRNRNISANFDRLTTFDIAKFEEIDFFSQPYPNPFNPVSNFSFGLLNQSNVTLKIIDINGKIVETIFDSEILLSGVYQRIFNAKNLASGVYFYKFIKYDLSTQKSISKSGKLLLIK